MAPEHSSSWSSAEPVDYLLQGVNIVLERLGVGQRRQLYRLHAGGLEEGSGEIGARCVSAMWIEQPASVATFVAGCMLFLGIAACGDQ
jgi:hypothetical protein